MLAILSRLAVLAAATLAGSALAVATWRMVQPPTELATLPIDRWCALVIPPAHVARVARVEVVYCARESAERCTLEPGSAGWILVAGPVRCD